MRNLRRPTAWTGVRVLGCIFAMIMVPAVVALFASAGRGANAPTAVVAVALGLAILLMLVGIARIRIFEFAKPELLISNQGTTLKYDLIYDRVMRAALAFGAVGGVGFIALNALDVLSLSLSPGQKLFFPLGMAVIVGAAVWGEYMRATSGPAYIRLDDDAIVLHQNSTETSIRWSDIRSLRPDRIGSRPRRDVIVIVSAGKREPDVINDAPFYTPAGSALYWMLRFYCAQPEMRIELTNGCAAQRLLAGDFPDGDV